MCASRGGRWWPTACRAGKGPRCRSRGSVTARRPVAASWRMAAAVKVLVIEFCSKRVAGVLRTLRAESANPYPLRSRTCPRRATRTAPQNPSRSRLERTESSRAPVAPTTCSVASESGIAWKFGLARAARSGRSNIMTTVSRQSRHSQLVVMELATSFVEAILWAVCSVLAPAWREKGRASPGPYADTFTPGRAWPGPTRASSRSADQRAPLEWQELRRPRVPLRPSGTRRFRR